VLIAKDHRGERQAGPVRESQSNEAPTGGFGPFGADVAARTAES
jgi:hypothetical protein